MLAQLDSTAIPSSNNNNNINACNNSLNNSFNNINCFDNLDFSLKQSDSLDFLSQVGGVNNLPCVGLTSNPSFFEVRNNQFDNFIAAATVAGDNNTNQFSLCAVNSAANYPWLNQQYDQQHNQINNDDDDGYDFMNFYPEENQSSKNHNFLQNFNHTHNSLEIDGLHQQTEQSSGDFFQFEQAIKNVNVTHNLHVNPTPAFIPIEHCFQEEKRINNDQNEKLYKKEAQLLKMSDFDKMLPEMEFEPFSEEEQRQIKQFNDKCKLEGKNHKTMTEADLYGRGYFKILPQILNKKKRRDYDKNICRYIARQMMRSFISEEYKSIVLSRFCKDDVEIFERVVPFVKSSISAISGHRAFKDLLQISKEETQEIKQMKIILRRFTKWFLRERSLRYIMLGNSEDKTQYIRFKNQVMLHFIDKPEQWNANLKINPKPFRIRTNVISQVDQENNNQTSSQSSSSIKEDY